MKAELGRAMAPHPVHRLHRSLALILGGWLLFLLAESSPHLVHHLLDPNPDSDHDCSYLAAADHAPAALAEPAPAPHGLGVQAHPAPVPVTAGRSTAARPAATRAPPAARLARA
jgi:hypothetical protein